MNEVLVFFFFRASAKGENQIIIISVSKYMVCFLYCKQCLHRGDSFIKYDEWIVYTNGNKSWKYDPLKACVWRGFTGLLAATPPSTRLYILPSASKLWDGKKTGAAAELITTSLNFTDESAFLVCNHKCNMHHMSCPISDKEKKIIILYIYTSSFQLYKCV